MMFKLEPNKDLFYQNDGNWQQVQLKSCFPYESKYKFLSVLDKNGKELNLIDDLKILEGNQREILLEYLSFKTFEFEVIGIYRVEEDFGVRAFEVKTQAGGRKFQTELDYWPEKIDDGSFLLKDLYGDIFRINQLDFGHKYLEPLID